MHLPAFAQMGQIGELMVADPFTAALKRLTEQFPTLAVKQMDYRAALERAAAEDVSAVIVALPNALHEDAVSRALDAGLDVLCEKPLALTCAACERLDKQAQVAGRILAVGMVRRGLASTQALRRALQEGWLGEITAIEVEDGAPFAWSSESGIYFRAENAGVLANVGVHPLDLVEYLAGRLEPVSYTDDNRGGAEANAEYILKTENGAPVRMRLSYTHLLRNHLVIHGTRGTLRLENSQPDRAFFRAHDDGLDAIITPQKPFRFGDWKPNLSGAFSEQFADFQDACATRRAPIATAADAVRTAQLIDWAYAQVKPKARISVSESAPLPEERIVITGGTGFVGAHLVEELAERGATDLLLPVRSYRSGANVGRFPVRMQRIDLLDSAGLREVMQGARYVFHLAFGRDGGNERRVTLEGTQNVVEAAIAANAESVVVLSTTAVYGDPSTEHEVDESFPYAPVGNYETSKAATEKWTLARAQASSSTRICVINSACVYGPRGKAFTELPARLVQEKNFAWVEQGRGIANYVFVKNLADALILAACDAQAYGERFIVSDGATTWRDFFTQLFEARVEHAPSYTRAELTMLARAREPKLRDLGRALVRNPEVWRVVRENSRLARGKELARKITPYLFDRIQRTKEQTEPARTEAVSESPVPPLWLADLYGTEPTRFTSAKAQRVLGWTPRVGLAEGQQMSREWLKQVRILE